MNWWESIKKKTQHVLPSSLLGCLSTNISPTHPRQAMMLIAPESLLEVHSPFFIEINLYSSSLMLSISLPSRNRFVLHLCRQNTHILIGKSSYSLGPKGISKVVVFWWLRRGILKSEWPAFVYPTGYRHSHKKGTAMSLCKRLPVLTVPFLNSFWCSWWLLKMLPVGTRPYSLLL